MNFLEWKKENEISFSEIDKQHKDIYATINRLYDLKDSKKEQILKLYEDLLVKFRKHFESEEKFMKQHNAIELFSHRLEHERAYKKYDDYFNKLKRKNSKFNDEILISLKTWIENHAIFKDSKLKKYVN